MASSIEESVDSAWDKVADPSGTDKICRELRELRERRVKSCCCAVRVIRVVRGRAKIDLHMNTLARALMISVCLSGPLQLEMLYGQQKPGIGLALSGGGA